jgi:hypothetical protein
VPVIRDVACFGFTEGNEAKAVRPDSTFADMTSEKQPENHPS